MKIILDDKIKKIIINKEWNCYCLNIEYNNSNLLEHSFSEKEFLMLKKEMMKK